MHRLLKRQIKKHLTQEEIKSLSDFLQVIEAAYKNYDSDLLHLETILEISSKELFKTNQFLNTEINQRTKELKESEERYQNIFENAFDAILTLDTNGKISNYNKKFLEITEYLSEDLANLTIADLVYHKDIEKSKEYFTKLVQNGFYKDYRGRIISKSGKIVHVEVNSIALYDSNGVINGSIDVVRDISDRIASENQIFESGQRFKALFENTSLGIVINSITGKLIDVNSSFINMLGYSFEELVSKKLNEIIYTEDYEIVKKGVKELRNNYLSLFNIECRFNHKNGNLIWGKITATTIKNKSGRIQHLIAIIEDITTWKNAHDLLEQNEEKWRFVIENMELGLLEVDKNGIILKAYDRFCKMVGYSQEELIGKDPVELFLFEKQSIKILEENNILRKKGINSVYEIELTKKNGETIWVMISGASLKNDKNEIVGSIGIHMDITNRKKIQQQLIEAREKAEESAKTKETFLANMSHEIRTPMNAIMGMTKLLKSDTHKNQKVKYLNAIESSAENLLVIINDILDISKIEANKLELDHISFDLKKLTKNIFQLLEYKAEEKGILLELNFMENINTNLKGDPVRISQIITNLLSNAIKFTRKGSVCLCISETKSTKTHNTFLFQVSDTGIGIDDLHLNKIFESFTQEDQEITREFGGTGLGLSITKKLIELHKSKIYVSSEKGKGTKFWFELNLEKDTVNTPEQKEINKEISLKKINGSSILLVEDHEINRFLAETILQSWNVKVTHAFNGMDAIEKVKNEVFDIILMDIQMPKMNGFEATKIIREELKITTPIIALTANAIKGDDVKCIEAGMDDYVSKPFEPSDLFNKIISQLKK